VSDRGQDTRRAADRRCRLRRGHCNCFLSSPAPRAPVSNDVTLQPWLNPMRLAQLVSVACDRRQDPGRARRQYSLQPRQNLAGMSRGCRGALRGGACARAGPGAAPPPRPLRTRHRYPRPPPDPPRLRPAHHDHLTSEPARVIAVVHSPDGSTQQRRTRWPPDSSTLLPEHAGHRPGRVFEPDRIAVGVPDPGCGGLVAAACGAARPGLPRSLELFTLARSYIDKLLAKARAVSAHAAGRAWGWRALRLQAGPPGRAGVVTGGCR
jgi:hypothetical protein